MDAHVHLDTQMGKDWRQDLYEGLTKTDAEVALDAVPFVRATLLSGFTTVRSLGSSDFGDVGLRNAIRDGAVPGPRVLAAGWPLAHRRPLATSMRCAMGCSPSRPRPASPTAPTACARRCATW